MGEKQCRLQPWRADEFTSGATPSGGARSRARDSTIPRRMCLAKGGVAYVANRGNENNFGMRVNEVKIGGPGEEELLAEVFQWGEGDGRSTWPFGVATDGREQVYVSDEWDNKISVFDKAGKVLREWGKSGSGDGELMRPEALSWGLTGKLF